MWFGIQSNRKGGCVNFFEKILLSLVLVLLVSFASKDLFAQQLIKPRLSSENQQGFDLSPSRPLAQPGTSGPQFGGGSSIVPFSSDWIRDQLPQIPNLEFAFLYTFGSNLRQTRWIVDYVKPFEIFNNNYVFAELHAEYLNYKSTIAVPFLDNFWSQGPPGSASRTDLSIGGGYRKLVGNDLLIGFNGFYDSTRLVGNWYSAGGFGLLLAANGPGDSMVDLNANYYSNTFGNYDSRGSLFPTFNVIDSVKSGGGSYDFEAGYSQALFDREYDLRLKVNGYQFLVGDQFKPGIKTGAEITTRDGVWKIGIEYGHDAITGQYGTVGAALNIGLQLENITKGESPFGKPEPVFRSPRNLKRLVSQPVYRNWRKPESVVANPRCYGTPPDSDFYLASGTYGFYKGWSTTYMAPAFSYLGYQVVTDTAGGKAVNIYVKPYNDYTQYTRDIEPMFECMSAAYARAASGDVLVLFKKGYYNDRSSIWYRIELPNLLNNPNVGSIHAYEAKYSWESGQMPTDYAGVTWSNYWNDKGTFK